MAEFTNNANPTRSPQSSLNSKVAQLITLPTTDNQAPGKTGNQRFPIRIQFVEIQYNGFEGNTPPTDSFIGAWNSDGTEPGYGSDPVSLTTTADADIPPFQNSGLIGKAAFGGNQYWIGFTSPPGAFLTWGVDNTLDDPFIPRIREDNTSHLGDFNNDDTAISDSSTLNGQLSYKITYSTAPGAPTNLTATPVSGSVAIDLDWDFDFINDDGGSIITGFRIQKSIAGGPFFDLITDTGNQNTGTVRDVDISAGTEYTYRVAARNLTTDAFDSSFTGPHSNTASATAVGTPGLTTSKLTVDVVRAEPEIVTFSDFGSGIPFTGLQVVFGSENLYNRVIATPAVGSRQTATAQQSVDDYGLRVFDIPTLNDSDGGALSVANEFLYRFFDPSIRIESISIDLSNLTNDERLAVLDLELDAGASVSFQPRRPGGAVIGEPITTTARIIGIDHNITPTEHIVNLRFDREETDVFTLDSVVNGLLDQNILG